MRGHGGDDGSTEKYVLGIFLDFTTAFDKLWWQGVLAELNVRNVQKEGYEFLKDYLSRSVELTAGGNQNRKEVSLGCPQGSVLGPQLWKLVFDSIVRRINGIGVAFKAYVDDEVVLVEG